MCLIVNTGPQAGPKLTKYLEKWLLSLDLLKNPRKKLKKIPKGLLEGPKIKNHLKQTQVRYTVLKAQVQ